VTGGATPTRDRRFERFDVRYKRNAKGEHVVVIIWPGWKKD
jgi:hypothetical protein